MSEFQIKAGDVLVFRGIRAKIVEFGAQRDASGWPERMGAWKAYCNVEIVPPAIKLEQQMTNQLNVGDVVKLNSGGPDMTVAVVRPNAKEAVCTWIGDGGTTPCAEFKSACLTLVRAAPEQPRSACATPLEKAAEEYRLASVERERTLAASKEADIAWTVARARASDAQERMAVIARGESVDNGETAQTKAV